MMMWLRRWWWLLLLMMGMIVGIVGLLQVCSLGIVKVRGMRQILGRCWTLCLGIMCYQRVLQVVRMMCLQLTWQGGML